MKISYTNKERTMTKEVEISNRKIKEVAIGASIGFATSGMIAGAYMYHMANQVVYAFKPL